MRVTGIKGFTVYDMHEGLVFQRGKLKRLDTTRMEDAFEHHGIEIVVGLNGPKRDENLQKLHDDELIDYFFYPIPDNKLSEEDAKWLLTVASNIAADIKYTGASVLSHCNAGRNRSGLMNALIIKELAHCTGKEAREIVQRERPNALANDHFVAFLDGLDGDTPIEIDDSDDVKIVLVMAGSGSAGKSTTTKAFAIGKPEEHMYLLDWTDRSNKPRNDKVKYTLYDNCALTGNHHSGTDCNNSPSMIKSVFKKCMRARDIVIVDGFCSSPQWVDMINDWNETHAHVLLLYFDLTAEEVLERLAIRRGVDKESIRERMYGKSQRRPTVMRGHFENRSEWPVTIVNVVVGHSTEEIVDNIDAAIEEIWEDYGYEVDYE